MYGYIDTHGFKCCEIGIDELLEAFVNSTVGSSCVIFCFPVSKENKRTRNYSI